MSFAAFLLSDCDENGAAEVAKKLGLIGPESSSAGQGDYTEISEQVVGVTSISSWGIVFCDSGLLLEVEEAIPNLSEASSGHRLFFWLTQSTSGAYWFEYHEFGELKRKWLEIEGEVEENEGNPLKNEREGVFTSEPDEEGERDEDAIFELADATTDVSTEDLFAASFSIYPSVL